MVLISDFQRRGWEDGPRDPLPEGTAFVTADVGDDGLGSMIVVLPWHDPVRVAENFSVLDHMTGGRALLGIGRGLARCEFELESWFDWLNHANDYRNPVLKPLA